MCSTIKGMVGVLGRMLLVAIFLMSAVANKIPNYSQVTSLLEGKGIPMPQVALALAIGFLLVGGLSVLVGYKARFGAALLAVFLALATFYFHDFWAVPSEQVQTQITHFMKNLALFGAMLFIVANGAGAWSIDECQCSTGTASGHQSQTQKLAG